MLESGTSASAEAAGGTTDGPASATGHEAHDRSQHGVEELRQERLRSAERDQQQGEQDADPDVLFDQPELRALPARGASGQREQQATAVERRKWHQAQRTQVELRQAHQQQGQLDRVAVRTSASLEQQRGRTDPHRAVRDAERDEQAQPKHEIHRRPDQSHGDDLQASSPVGIGDRERPTQARDRGRDSTERVDVPSRVRRCPMLQSDPRIPEPTGCQGLHPPVQGHARDVRAEQDGEGQRMGERVEHLSARAGAGRGCSRRP